MIKDYYSFQYHCWHRYEEGASIDLDNITTGLNREVVVDVSR